MMLMIDAVDVDIKVTKSTPKRFVFRFFDEQQMITEVTMSKDMAQHIEDMITDWVDRKKI